MASPSWAWRDEDPPRSPVEPRGDRTLTRKRTSVYVSRAGEKLAHAIAHFVLDVEGKRVVDFGCNIGGFTDCLLAHGAAHVHAVDTGYGVLHWSLRQDDRVTVLERTNVLHETPHATVDLAVIDLAWTRQYLSLPAARGWLTEKGRVLTLVKPHYELEPEEKKRWLVDGRLDHAKAEDVLQRILAHIPSLGFHPCGWVLSPMRGGKSSRRGTGNIEFLVLASVAGDSNGTPGSAEPTS